MTHDMEKAGAHPAGKLNTNIQNSRYICKYRQSLQDASVNETAMLKAVCEQLFST